MKKIKVPEAEKLPSGSYRCRVMVNGQKKSFTAPTKREAEQAALEYKIGLLAEENEKPEITIRKAIDEYLTLKSGVLSPASMRGHRIKQRCYLQSIMDIPLSELSVSAIQQAINTEKCSPKTIRETWALIRPALKRYRFPLFSPTSMHFCPRKKFRYSSKRQKEANTKLHFCSLCTLCAYPRF